ncbi:MAG: hypothetical protein KF861_07865 [Planctomycetaceae bacterium]|nr:hypothetical protein [Planctomycetaceae bacterium]
MSLLTVRPRLVRCLYTSNPFYVISTVLMLYAVRRVYGDLEIGAINCWVMMGVLAGYTSLLAVIGVLIVRWGKVWDDARSILLLLLLLFLAVSISADDLFATMESGAGAVLLPLSGFLFSAIVTELVLRGARIRLGLRYRVPLHLMYALFYAAPWACSAALELESNAIVAWRVFLFPVAAAAVLLTLVPAVRGGAAYASGSGTPWPWPLFPWITFGVIVAAVALRTFALAMTFGPEGPIWVPKSSGLAISFETMWGPYFLIPLAFSVLLLVLEGGLVAGNQRLVRHVLLAVPFLLLLAVPISGGPVFRGFLREVTTTLGSPLWLTVWGMIGFYSWAWWRGAAAGEAGVLASATLLTVIGPSTVGPATFLDPRTGPLVMVGLAMLVSGLHRRSASLCFLSTAMLTLAAWVALPQTSLAGFRMSISYHLLWGAAIVIGLMGTGRVARGLRFAGALQMPVAALLATVGPGSAEIPVAWSALYVVFLTAACFAIAQAFSSRWYLYAFTSLLAIIAYGVGFAGFRALVREYGGPATTAVLWSVGTLLTAVLISAHKAGWVPQRLFPRGANGHTPPPPAAS